MAQRQECVTVTSSSSRKRDRFWDRFLRVKMKYLIFSFPRSGYVAKCGVEFRHSKRNGGTEVSRWVRSILTHKFPGYLCILCYVRDTTWSYKKIKKHFILLSQLWYRGTKCDCKRDRLWVRYPIEEIKHILI